MGQLLEYGQVGGVKRGYGAEFHLTEAVFIKGQGVNLNFG